MPHLLFSQHGKTLLQVPLSKENIQIGRSQACDIVLNEPTISRLQLAVYQIEGSYFVKNLGKAKLKLNGHEIESAPFLEKDHLELENWQISFSHSQENEKKNDETYVSDAGMQRTQVLHLSRVEDTLHYESLELHVLSPGEELKIYPLQQAVLTIGKSSSCDIKLVDPFVSEVHAKLISQHNKVIIYDLQSTNGTFMNGIKIGEVEAKVGIPLQMGKSELKLESISHQKKIQPVYTHEFGPLVGQSKIMRELYALIQQVAPVNIPVCILGETGTGKELVAKCLHDLSPRKSGPWIALNCGAIAKELIQSEFFGHEKGAFTGAHQPHKGVFEQASGGTLFLDEIGELPLELQASFLRILETGKLRRVGGSEEIGVDVRIVCATHRDLSEMIAHKTFREDLFFRLHVFPLFLPPLRLRKEDVPILAEHFLSFLTPPERKLSLSKECREFLVQYPWWGNVRELKNAIQRALILVKNEILQASDFSFLEITRGNEAVSGPSKNPMNGKLEEIEKQFILKEFQAQNHNKIATARALGIAKSTLYDKLRLYGIK